MAKAKIAISVPQEVLTQVDAAASARGMSRSGYISDVLFHVGRAYSNEEIKRRVREVFAEVRVRKEQTDVAHATNLIRPREGSEW